MDATPATEVKEPAGELQSESSAVKSPVENGGGLELGELGDRCSKKPKVEAASSGELKRVAEIVLVLSTMATMRGGRKPADVETELMKEARTKLVELCQGLAPKDIVAREAIGPVIEDLGLNGNIKEQKLGFRTPKMSIAERLSHTKWKMEEAKKFSAHSTTYGSQPLQTSIGGTVDNHAPSHTIRIFSSDKSSHTAAPSSGTLASTPMAHASAASSATLQYQSTSNEGRPPIVSGGMPGSHLGRNSSSLALPKVEQPQFKVDGGSNGSSYVLQVQANSSANQPLVNAPTWSIQTQSASLARSAPENKVPGHTSLKVEGTNDANMSRGAPQIARDQSFRPFITQTAPGNMSSMHQQLHGVNIQPPSLANNHAEIAKIVQKVLQPKLPEHPTWNPPSRDYMNKALTCQMCELTVNEVDTVILCDACEKGFHLKCLQSTVFRGIPRGEWHCMRCLALSGGKPLPPKYGRVMRSSNTPPKLPSNISGIQPSLEKKDGVLDLKVSPQNLTTNGSSVPTSTTGNNVEPLSGSKTLDTKEIQGNTVSSSIKQMDEKSDLDILTKSPSAASSHFVGLPVESPAQQMKNSEASSSNDITLASEKSETENLKISESKGDKMQLSPNLQVKQTVLHEQVEVSSDKLLENSLTNNSQSKSQGRELFSYDIKRDNQNVTLANSDQSYGTNDEGRQHSILPSDGSNAVQWIGDAIQLVDEKKFYQSCCVDGETYRIQDHALFPSSHGKLIPSKLQSMWEDSKTGLKWVNVTKCYFPGDLPGNIGHPCISEVNEVYESNSNRTEMAGSIRGPCEVLPSVKFKQETDRRIHLGLEASARLQPIFLCRGSTLFCRWFYDELKKLFQPVTS